MGMASFHTSHLPFHQVDGGKSWEGCWEQIPTSNFLGLVEGPIFWIRESVFSHSWEFPDVPEALLTEGLLVIKPLCLFLFFWSGNLYLATELKFLHRFWVTNRALLHPRRVAFGDIALLFEVVTVQNRGLYKATKSLDSSTENLVLN